MKVEYLLDIFMKIVQFGEGNFLRGFVDWMFDKLGYEVTVVQPIEKGMLDELAAQNYKYNLLLRGIENGRTVEQKTEITCIKDGINPYREWDKFLNFAKDKDLQVVVSNTTESGIEYKPQDASEAPYLTFPAKLTLFLKSRFDAGLDGMMIFPCELIDNNGTELYNYVVKYANDWNMGDDFLKWLDTNHFCNTLVDRIVTGYPNDMDTDGDKMFNTAEIFYLWVIQGDFEHILPFRRSGFKVIWAEDVTPYKKRKVRILNGAHTALVSYASLKGFTSVGECMKDEEMKGYIKSCIFDEIIPALDLPVPEEKLKIYANSVLDRFANPYINHMFSAIALNSFDKFKVRVMPSILEYEKKFGKKPENLMKAFYALCEFYKTDMVNDAPEIIEFMRNASAEEVWARLC